MFFSSDVQIGGWNIQDMGTDNPQPNWTDDRIKNYFPENFPRIALTELNLGIQNQDENIIRTILGLQESDPVDFSTADEAQDFLLTAMSKDSDNHQTLLDRLPEKYKSLYTLDAIQAKMRDMRTDQGDEVLNTYNEAKIRYQPNDILGIFVVKDNETSVATAT